ncbi:AAA family ATPase [Melittangium boletus]|uniref:Guanylate cyclase domain-containing protein n=1 Tax=Melittangium boletus DSM 14713 TaxID=1294270 RepID=A0A250IMC4_9BACT|nr:adenylate/guanylate cyclase domain-containing protein [Melittangium boletus]ATB32899.1 hypothetical protein MEBOL_006388 [Melittangium boletus DSM 14713]
MIPTSRLQALASFVPSSLVRGLAADETRPREGARSSAPAVLLFADVSGFTPLTEALERSGPEGAERLSAVINTCFSTLLETVLDHGGDILRFAGDAILALWPAEEPSDSARMAARCAQAIQVAVAKLDVEGVRLKLRIGITAGPVVLSDVGGENGRWEFLATGPILREMAQAQGDARPGEVVLSAEAWRWLGGIARGEALPSGCIRLEELPSMPLPRVRLPEAYARMERSLRAYLPEVVLRRLDAGHSQWLSEFRAATILFIGLMDPSLSTGERPETIQHAFRAIQAGLQRYEGGATQVVVDDKGVVTVAAFGLPPLSHEDDASRACRAALQIHASLTRLGLTPCLGITSGRVLCCAYGTAFRREYVMVGRAVNLSARLMQASRGRILCDSHTARLASHQMMFETLDPIQVKGRQEPVELFRLVAASSAYQRPPRQVPLVGRREERARLAEAVHALSTRAEGGMVWIEGEAGMGKSRLVEHLIAEASSAGLETSLGEGHVLEGATPYHVWREPLARLLGLKDLPDEAARTALLLSLLENRPDAREKASLLNELLSVSVPETDWVRGLSGELRANNTRELLMGLLAEACQARPRVVVLDDVHWMDSSSWELVTTLQGRLGRLLLVLASRQMEHPPAGASQLRAHPGLLHLLLERLHPLDTLSLVSARIGARSLTPELAEYIREKAEGNPFFSGELAFTLVEHGHVVIDQDVARLKPGTELSQLDLPHTVQGVVSSRIDRLTPTQQLVLKVASIVGRVFSLETIEALYPVKEDKSRVGEELEALVRTRLVTRQMAESKPVYAFEHALIQDAAYAMMIFSQRRRLHRDLAMLLEREPDSRGGVALHARMAHHWRMAEESSHAVTHLEKAGTVALSTGAFREAYAFLWDARQLGERLEIDSLRRARWSAGMGEALRRVGDMSDAQEHLSEALRFLGRRLPRTPSGWMTRGLWEVGRQFTHLLFQRAPQNSHAANERLSLSSRVLAMMGQIYFFYRQPAKLLTCSLMSINDAEAAGRMGVAAEAYATLAYTAGLAQLLKLSLRYTSFMRATSDPSAQALSYLTESSIVSFCGAPSRSLALGEQALEKMRRLNDPNGMGQALIPLILSMQLWGYSKKALRYREALLTVGRESTNPQHFSWAHVLGSPSLLMQARPEELLAGLGELKPLLPQIEREEPTIAFGHHTASALAFAHLEDWGQAREWALRAFSLREGFMPKIHNYCDVFGLAGLVDVCFLLWENALSHGMADANEWRRHTLTALRALRRFARIHPFGRTFVERFEGHHHAVTGDTSRALRLFIRARNSAREYGLEHEEGVALYELGRWSPEHKQRRAFLSEAHDIFTRLEAVHDLRAMEPLAPEFTSESHQLAVG